LRAMTISKHNTTMNTPYKKFHTAKDQIKEISLDDAERQNMLGALLDHARSHPAPAIAESEKVVPSRWLTWIDVVAITSKKIYASNPLRAALVLILVLCISSYGTVQAAQGSLPGDVLYPIKTKIAEPIRDLFTFGAADRAQWEVEKASRRLDEAEGLAEQGRLDSDKKIELEHKFIQHIEAFNAIQDREVKANGVTKAVISERINLADSVNRHVDTLSTIKESNGKGKEQISSFNNAVIDKVESSFRRGRGNSKDHSWINGENASSSATATVEIEHPSVIKMNSRLNAQHWDQGRDNDDESRAVPHVIDR